MIKKCKFKSKIVFAKFASLLDFIKKVHTQCVLSLLDISSRNVHNVSYACFICLPKLQAQSAKPNIIRRETLP